MKKILLPVLWILILFFAYKLFYSIYDPIQFNNVKVERYANVIANLKDIGKAQVAHKSVNGYYAQDFKSLVKFIDTAEYVIVEKETQVIWNTIAPIASICCAKFKS